MGIFGKKKEVIQTDIGAMNLSNVGVIQERVPVRKSKERVTTKAHPERKVNVREESNLSVEAVQGDKMQEQSTSIKDSSREELNSREKKALKEKAVRENKEALHKDTAEGSDADSGDLLESLIEKQIIDSLDVVHDELMDSDVTDIDWDGELLAMRSIKRGFYTSDKKIPVEKIDGLASQLGSIMHTKFSRQNQILEANTGVYRITIWHESMSSRGYKSMSIRKIPKEVRYKHPELVRNGFAPAAVLNLIENAVSARMSCIIGGQPGAGKTEFLKFLTEFIPENEIIGLYEENAEVHLKDIRPNRMCRSCLIDGERMTYGKAIKAGLKHNISYIILSEARGQEVTDLINALSTGSACMSTIHLGDVRRLPNRIGEMTGNSEIAESFEDKAYRYIDLCVLVTCDEKQRRKIEQVAFYTREEGKNKCHVV